MSVDVSELIDIQQHVAQLAHGRGKRGIRRSGSHNFVALSFAGMLTYKNAQALRAVAAALPLDRVLVETDSPYLAPVPLRGKRNEPANVVHTAATLAQVLGVRPLLGRARPMNVNRCSGLG